MKPLDDFRALARRDISGQPLVTIAAWVRDLRQAVLALCDVIDELGRRADIRLAAPLLLRAQRAEAELAALKARLSALEAPAESEWEEECHESA